MDLPAFYVETKGWVCWLNHTTGKYDCLTDTGERLSVASPDDDLPDRLAPKPPTPPPLPSEAQR